jgi:membrane protein DedA with SNARE-associated domain
MSGLIGWLTDTVSQVGYEAIFGLMLLETVVLPIPSEVIMPYAGYLASQGRLSLVGAAAIGGLGSVVGAMFLYAISRRFGHDALVRLRIVRERDLMRAERWLNRYGLWAAFLGRLVPGVRTVVSIPAGLGRVPWVPYLLLSYAGSFLWALVLAWIGFQLKDRWSDVEAPIQVAATIILVGLISLIGWWLWRRRRSKK